MREGKGSLGLMAASCLNTFLNLVLVVPLSRMFAMVSTFSY